MSGYKDQRKELGIGSTGDMQSTQDGSKWHHGVDAAGIAKLTRLSGEITDLFDKSAREFAKVQINLGRLLNEARSLIPGDQQFGQWREKNTPITNKSTANKLMNLAKQVGDGRITQDMIEQLPLSTLKELLSAPDNVLTHVRDKLREGEQVARQEIRDMGKTTSETQEHEVLEVEAPEPSQKTPEVPEVPEAPVAAPKAPAAPPVNRVTLASVAESIISMHLEDRLRRLDMAGEPPYPGCKREEWAWLVVGLDPIPAYMPNRLLVESMAGVYSGLVVESNPKDADRLLEILNKAFSIIESQY